jgi:hypothetical protein
MQRPLLAPTRQEGEISEDTLKRQAKRGGRGWSPRWWSRSSIRISRRVVCIPTAWRPASRGSDASAMTRGRVAPTQSSRCSGCSNGSEVPSARPTRPEGDRREVVTIEPALFYRLQAASSSVGQATMEGSLKMQSLVRRRRNVSARCPAGANGNRPDACALIRTPRRSELPVGNGIHLPAWEGVVYFLGTCVRRPPLDRIGRGHRL